VLEMIGRITAAVFLSRMLGYTGIALASTLAWLLADCFLIPAFFICFRKLTDQRYSGS